MFACLNLLNLDDLVMWSAITLAFRAVLRISNVCGKSHALLFKDIELFHDRIVIKLASSKTNQFASRPHVIVIVANSASKLCPVYWLKEMLRLSRPSQGDRLFRLYSNGQWVPMTQSWFSKRFKLLSIKAGLGQGYSTHSLRRGAASHMSELDYKLTEIKQRGGWASSTVLKYIDMLSSHAHRLDVKFAVSLP